MITGEALNRERRKWLSVQQLPLDTPMTCDTCEDNEDCPSSFDMYNTNGDCLEDK
jgi:hypothetical protein